MRAAPTPKLTRVVTLAGISLLAALLLGRVELVVVVAPLLVSAAVGVAAAKPPQASVALDLTVDRALAGDTFEATVTVRSTSGCQDLEIGLRVPTTFEVVDGTPRASVSLGRGGGYRHSIRLQAKSWGVHSIGIVAMRSFGPGRLIAYESVHDVRRNFRVYPKLETLRSAITPPQTQVFAGNYVGRTTGAGIEFADVRGFVGGDRLKHVNWRVSSRRQDLYVNVFHPERNSDIVLFLDTFTDVGPSRASSLDVAVRGATSLARHYLSHRDRVALVGFGGVLKWLTASMGERQFYRIADYVLDLEVSLSYAWKDIDVLPARTLPPLSLVVALSPLIDRRAIEAVMDLRARGFPVVAIDTLNEDAVEPGPGAGATVAFKAWRLQRQALRFELTRSGVAVVEWAGERPLTAVLSAVPDLRRELVMRS